MPAAQYRDRNKLGITLELKTPEGVELFKELVAPRRRRDRELQRRHDGAPGPRLRGPPAGEPRARLRLDHRVRPERALRRAAGLRHAGPGDQRLHEHHRLPRAARPRARASPSPTTTRACSAPSASCRRCTTAHRTGKGQRIDLALLDSLLVALDNLGERYTVGGEILTRAGNVSFAGSSSGVYPTTDGHVAVVAGASNAVWRRFCEIIGRADLARDPGFATAAARRDRRDEIAAIIQGWTERALQGRGGRARWRRPASPRRRSTTWRRWSPIPRCRRARCSSRSTIPSTDR